MLLSGDGLPNPNPGGSQVPAPLPKGGKAGHSRSQVGKGLSFLARLCPSPSPGWRSVVILLAPGSAPQNSPEHPRLGPQASRSRRKPGSHAPACAGAAAGLTCSAGGPRAARVPGRLRSARPGSAAAAAAAPAPGAFHIRSAPAPRAPPAPRPPPLERFKMAVKARSGALWDALLGSPPFREVLQNEAVQSSAAAVAAGRSRAVLAAGKGRARGGSQQLSRSSCPKFSPGCRRVEAGAVLCYRVTAAGSSPPLKTAPSPCAAWGRSRRRRPARLGWHAWGW